MENKRIAVSILLVMILLVSANAQNYLNGVECVSFDEAHNRYLVSSMYNGRIVAIDMEGNQTTWKHGLGECYGNCILGNTFYVTVNTHTLKGFDLDTREEVLNIYIPPLNNLDGMAADSSGQYLYVVDTGGRIHKIDLQSHMSSIFVSSGLAAWTQDIIYDHANDRLLTASWSSNAPVQAISLEDSSISTAVVTPYGYYDGITIDQFGNIYLGSHWGADFVVVYDSEFTDPPELIYGNFADPAGLDYNQRDDILAVPNFSGDSVEFIYIQQSGVEPMLSIQAPGQFRLEAGYPNPFNAVMTIPLIMENSAQVEISVYDNLGRRISVLAQGNYGPGEHIISWNADDLASGVYFIRGLCGSKGSCQRVVLTK